MTILEERLQLDMSAAAPVCFRTRSSWAHLKFELHHPSLNHRQGMFHTGHFSAVTFYSYTTACTDRLGARITRCYQHTQQKHTVNSAEDVPHPGRGQEKCDTKYRPMGGHSARIEVHCLQRVEW